MKKCCAEFLCRNNFKNLPDRLTVLEWEPIFYWEHRDLMGDPVHTVPPKNPKWAAFLQDYIDYLWEEYREDGYKTDLAVNGLSDKITIHWRVMQRYKGRYEGLNTTRNVVDVKVFITSLNMKGHEHFTYS